VNFADSETAIVPHSLARPLCPVFMRLRGRREGGRDREGKRGCEGGTEKERQETEGKEGRDKNKKEGRDTNWKEERVGEGGGGGRRKSAEGRRGQRNKREGHRERGREKKWLHVFAQAMVLA